MLKGGGGGGGDEGGGGGGGGNVRVRIRFTRNVTGIVLLTMRILDWL